MTAPAHSTPPAERTHYWLEEPDGWTVEIVSQGAAAPIFRAYVGQRTGDDEKPRRRHKTPWVVTESEAWLDGRGLIALERARAMARRVPWWRRLAAALRASFAKWRAP